jgi:FAD/FMN-containing dehydrogenase
MVGSEGTLGIVVGATLRLAPQPEERGALLVGLPFLDSIPSAASAAAEANASACELFGRRLLDMAGLAVDPLVRDAAQGAAAVVLLEVEGDTDQVESGLALLKRWADEEGVGSVATTDEEGQARLWEIRHAASPLIARTAERGRRSTQFIEDSVVPVAAVPNYLRGVSDILERAGTEAVIFGHAGDGNIHVNPLMDVRALDRRARVRTILEETVALVVGLGGTLSGEHGDGRVRAPFVDRIWSPELVSVFREVKERLDPDGLMNPGVILPLPGQDPLEGLWAD